ncbi:MAG: TonB-dependent receptor [Steroidobacteraceae bacterium]
MLTSTASRTLRDGRLPLILSAAGSLLALTALPAAHAANAEATATAALEEIVVTARRSEESLQETPVSVVAVSADQLVSMGVDSLKNFDAFVPNLSIGGTMGQGSAVANFAIRGIGGASSGFITQESAVGVYVDDILYAHPNGALLEMIDAAQLEVLRGPQGTLFGRNTAGGAVRYTTKKPDANLGGNFKATLGSYNRRDVSGTLNLPLSDSVFFRGSFANKSRDGYIYRLVDGNSTGAENVTAARGQLRWQPTDRLDINLSADTVKTFDNGTATTIGGYVPTDLYPATLYNLAGPPTAAALRAATPASVTTFANAASDFAKYTVTDKYSVYGGTPDRNDFTATGFGLNIQYELTDNLSLKSLSGYNHAQQHMYQDWDRTPIVLFQLDEYIDMEYFTQEFQLNGKAFDNRLKWVGGLFYFRDNSFDDKYRSSPTDGVHARETKHLITTSYAVFGQGSYQFTDIFSATLGLRYNKDEKDYTASRNTRNLGNPYHAPKGTWDSLSPRIGFEQKWTTDFMTYVSAAKGFKAGGMNDTLVNSSDGSRLCSPGTAPVSGTNPPNCGVTEFKEENLWTYELGARSEFLDHRIRLNGTLFYTDYKDMQIQYIDTANPPPTQYNLNADATVYGAELDLTAAVTDKLTLRASYGYTHSEYGKDVAAQTTQAPPKAQLPALTQASPFLRSPKTSYTVAATYKQPLVNDAELVFDLNWGWKAEQSSTSTPTNTVIMPAYGLLNGRLEYRAAENWSVALYGNNLLDKYYLTSAMDPAGPTTKNTYGSALPHDNVFGFTMLDVGRPREGGVEFSYKF